MCFPWKFLPKLFPWICSYFAGEISDRDIDPKVTCCARFGSPRGARGDEGHGHEFAFALLRHLNALGLDVPEAPAACVGQERVFRGACPRLVRRLIRGMRRGYSERLFSCCCTLPIAIYFARSVLCRAHIDPFRTVRWPSPREMLSALALDSRSSEEAA